MRLRIHLLLGVLGACLISSTHLSADILYSVTDLGNLGGSQTFVSGINNAGQFTGSASTPGHAFIYSNGQIKDLGTLGPSYLESKGLSINNAGQVTGYAQTGLFESHAFLYSDGQIKDLGSLGGSNSYAYGINNAGQVTGYSETTTPNQQHAFLYSNGQMKDLGTLGGSYSYAYGINNAGQVTGYSNTGDFLQRAFLYSDGQMVNLGTLGDPSVNPKFAYSYGYAINDAGQVTGYATTTDYRAHAFLYSNGQMTDLGVLPGEPASAGRAINNAGQVVGESSQSSDYNYTLPGRAFLYQNGQMFDLNNLIDPALHLTLAQATAINDSGQIVVNAVTGCYDQGCGFRTYLLTPIPEPGTLALFGTALFALSVFVRRRL